MFYALYAWIHVRMFLCSICAALWHNKQKLQCNHTKSLLELCRQQLMVTMQ